MRLSLDTYARLYSRACYLSRVYSRMPFLFKEQLHAQQSERYARIARYISQRCCR